MPHRPTIALIGAALDLGQGRRGVDMGPSAIRYGGLNTRLTGLEYTVRDLGNLAVEGLENLAIGDPQARYLAAILEYSTTLATLVEAEVEAGALPLILGGDHSLAIGVLGGLAQAAGRPGAAIWLDAHADCNTPPTSPSGNVHGMPVAAAAGLAPEWFAGPWPTPSIDPALSTLIGLRSVDRAERDNIRATGLAAVTMSDIDRLGMERVIEEAVARAEGAPWVHVSLDLDVVDPTAAPGVGTPVNGGISIREAHLAMELLCSAGFVQSLQVVELNPILDEHNRTGALAVDLICSALGQRIL